MSYSALVQERCLSPRGSWQSARKRDPRQILWGTITRSTLFIELKLEHLLLDADMRIKFEDFGFNNEFTFGNKLGTSFGSLPLCCPGTLPGPNKMDPWWMYEI